jgi:hypothetical protein
MDPPPNCRFVQNSNCAVNQHGNDDRCSSVVCAQQLEVAMKRHRGQPLPLEKKLQIVGELLQQRKEREALMASRNDARLHNRPPSRVRCSVAQSTVLIQLLFRSSTARRTKQLLTIKKNDDKQKYQRTTVKTFSTLCCDISRDGYSML